MGKKGKIEEEREKERKMARGRDKKLTDPFVYKSFKQY